MLWQAPRLSYTDNLKIRVRDVLLSPLGKETVHAMVKEARKVGPEAEESKAGLKQEVSESEEESKVPKEEMPYVEKLENELQKAREALVHERQQKALEEKTSRKSLEDANRQSATNAAKTQQALLHGGRVGGLEQQDLRLVVHARSRLICVPAPSPGTRPRNWPDRRPAAWSARSRPRP